MTLVLVPTYFGCRTFLNGSERSTELAGRAVSTVAAEHGGSCLAIVDEREIWRRANDGVWSLRATAEIPLQSITSAQGIIFAGGMNEATILRIPANGGPEPLEGFHAVPGRNEWFAVGPPLGIRSLAINADGSALLAAVHVGGIPRSTDGGQTWQPTIPVAFDVHEVQAHPTLPNIAVAAAAAGLCTSEDAGRTWRLHSERFEWASLLAVALVADEALFSVQDGPFAKRSQIWRWQIGTEKLEQVRDGLPEWLEGKVDTGHIAAGNGRAAVCDGSGTLWLSRTGSLGWERIATDLPYASGVVIL